MSASAMVVSEGVGRQAPPEAPDPKSVPVYATAWPVRRESASTLYRCRVWDGVCISEPFLLHAAHGFLGADPVVVLARLAGANEAARDILRRALVRGVAVEFNQEAQDTAVVSQALARLAPAGGIAVQ